MVQNFEDNIGFALNLDKNDPLKKLRDKFIISCEKTIYLDGNSLGRLSVGSRDQLINTIDKEWGTDLIESWNKCWYNKSEELGNIVAKIIGANSGEIIVCDSTSVNLYKLAYAALKLQPGRTRIVSDVLNFPTDLYVLQGIVNEFGENYELVLADSADDISVKTEDIDKLIDKNTALVVLSHVAFKSSFKYDLKEITDLAHKNGALVLWDLSHSAGVVDVDINNTNADMAVGCTYKYMNGGPGSPAFLYIKKELQKMLTSPLQGWFGHRKPFNFDLDYNPSEGIKKFLAGTPSVLSMMALEPALDIILEAGIDKIRKKSNKQTKYLLFLIDKILKPLEFQIGSPENVKNRGSHITIKHKEGYRICQALINPPGELNKVIPDFREPDNIRLGISPLYTTCVEIFNSVIRIKEIFEKKEYQKFSINKNEVT